MPGLNLDGEQGCYDATKYNIIITGRNGHVIKHADE